jgi:hypothetical protein
MMKFAWSDLWSSKHRTLSVVISWLGATLIIEFLDFRFGVLYVTHMNEGAKFLKFLCFTNFKYFICFLVPWKFSILSLVHNEWYKRC